MFYTMGGKLGLNPTSFWPERLAAIGFDPGGIRVGAFIFRGLAAIGACWPAVHRP